MGTLEQAATESDARIERMDRIAVLHGEITAATREFLRALAESDRHRDWAAEGFGSCAEWLAWRIGVNRNTANEKVRCAHALEHLPLISTAMARGEISFTKVRALTRAGTPENEAELLDFARAGSAASLERLIRGWKKLSRDDEQKQERVNQARRYFSVRALTRAPIQNPRRPIRLNVERTRSGSWPNVRSRRGPAQHPSAALAPSVIR